MPLLLMDGRARNPDTFDRSKVVDTADNDDEARALGEAYGATGWDVVWIEIDNENDPVVRHDLPVSAILEGSNRGELDE